MLTYLLKCHVVYTAFHVGCVCVCILMVEGKGVKSDVMIMMWSDGLRVKLLAEN
jgi:hypothetical protein